MEQLTALVKEYIQLSNQISVTSKHILTLKKTLKSYESDILDFLAKNDLDGLSSPDGGYIFRKASKTMSSINKDVVQEKLLETLGDADQVSSIMEKIMSGRQVKEKMVLKLQAKKK